MRFFRPFGVLSRLVLVTALLLPRASAWVRPGCDTLPRTCAAVAAGQPLVVVAIGSSSTAGAGATAPERAYPAQLEAAHLRRLSPRVPVLSDAVPPWLARLIHPISKTRMDPLRLLHFCALAVVVARIVPPTAGWLSAAFARGVRRMGENGLEVFCVGVILSLMVHFALTEIDAGPLLASAITLAGVLGLAAMARLSDWYDTVVDGTPRKTGGVAR
ncbi:MAG: OpgC domain-containing protein [Rhodospirillales bacterium]